MNSVVIVSAGKGSRMKADINKQFLKLGNKEVIAHTIDKFYNNENIGEIIVVVREDEAEFFQKNIIDKYGYENIKIAFGGKERQDSVFNGLKSVDKSCEIVLIHDGARPFVTDEIINNDNLILEQYSKYYDDINQNPIFYKAVERIVNRYAKNNKLDTDISKLLDKAFENTYTFCRR